MSYSSEVLADSPVIYYRMNEASGDIVDSSGNGNDSTSVEGTPLYGEDGALVVEPDDCIKVTASNSDQFVVPYNASMDVGDVLSAEAWIKRGDTSTGERAFFAKANSAFLGMLDHNIFFARSGITGICTSTITITDTDTFHHIVATKDGSDVHLYIDGADVTGTVTNSTFTDTSDSLYVGAENGGGYFTGWLDEIAIYDTALSPARVLAHYQAATSEPGPEFQFVRSNLRW